MLLAACSGSGSPDGKVIPQGAAPLTNLRTIPAKGTGVWGVAVGDFLYVEGGSNPSGCSGPPSNCSAWAQTKSLTNTGSSMSQYGSASFATTAALGKLLASGKAVSTGMDVQSATVQANVYWEDTFTIKSSTLPPGTPVSLKATLAVTPTKVHCTKTGFINVGAATSYSGLSVSELCSSSPPPVLTATINTSVGATFTDTGYLSLYLQAGTGSGGGKIGSGGFYKATYHLDPITSGAKYITASGKSYL